MSKPKKKSPVPKQLEKFPKVGRENPWLWVANEIERFSDNPRSQILVASGYLELLVNTVVECKCKHPDRLGRDLALKLVALNEAGHISDVLFPRLDLFRKVRNRAAHDVSFEVTAQEIEELLTTQHPRRPRTVQSACLDVTGDFWNEHVAVLVPVFAPDIAKTSAWLARTPSISS